jgi:hypothetical protein
MNSRKIVNFLAGLFIVTIVYISVVVIIVAVRAGVLWVISWEVWSGGSIPMEGQIVLVVLILALITTAIMNHYGAFDSGND